MDKIYLMRHKGKRLRWELKCTEITEGGFEVPFDGTVGDFWAAWKSTELKAEQAQLRNCLKND